MGYLYRTEYNRNRIQASVRVGLYIRQHNTRILELCKPAGGGQVYCFALPNYPTGAYNGGRGTTGNLGIEKFSVPVFFFQEPN